jgi:tRNA pseudouridine32 synthase/23S rRNA pseudouridine746 synthase
LLLFSLIRNFASMNLRVHPLHTDIEPPSELNSPFSYEPHPLCLLAAEEVKKYVRSHDELLEDAEKGEMFGVLIVRPNTTPRPTPALPVREGVITSEADENSLPKQGGSGWVSSLPSGGIEGGFEGFCPIGFLAAYAGLLAGRNDWDWFVPPIFDAQQPDGHFKQEEAKISALNKEIEALQAPLCPPKGGKVPPNLSSESESSPLRGDRGGLLLSLKHQRKQMSNDLLLWLFSQYNLINYKGEVRNVVDIWRDYHNSPKLLRKFPLPPGGTGECCAPKLFQYAFQHGLEPLAVAEFWWGESPKREIRHHFQFYPACNGKCKPILTWQLQTHTPNSGPTPALPMREGAITSEADTPPLPKQGGQGWVSPLPSGGAGVGIYVQTLFVDDQIAVVVKPEGLLSVPGNTGEISLYDIMRQRFPNATGPMMVHRLDQATSGIIVVAKTEFAYKQLQRQFENREVKKRYVAMVQPTLNPSRREGENTSEADKNSLPSGGAGVGSSGTISLPLAPDYLDRPRQVVDYEEGKPAVTDYEFIGQEGPYYRVLLTPHTGRTHQLRVHCAHQDGLGMPIVGDDLYGFHSDRLYLHAEYLSFTHPLTGETMEFEKKPDF